MLIKRVKDSKELVAGDKTLLREILHPKNDTIDVRYSIAHARVKPRHASLPHKLRTTEVYYILKGKGIMHVDRESREVEEGCAIYLPPNSVQYIENIGNEDVEFLCVVDPAWRQDDEEIVK